MKDLEKKVKSQNPGGAYLFFGGEPYFVELWRKMLINGVLPSGERDLNLVYFEGEKIPVQDIMQAAAAAPFFTDFRVIAVKGSGLFEAGRKEDSDEMAKFVKELPPSTVLLFSENKVDKRGRLYKQLAEVGLALESKTPKEAELADWAAKYLEERGKKIQKAVAIFLIRTVSANMTLLVNEMEKIIAYKGEETVITNDDIKEICTKSVEARIFDLTNAIGNRDARAAVEIYRNLIALKEHPLMILSMVMRHFRYCLQCSHLASTSSNKDIAARLGLHPFAVREFVAAARNFSRKAMLGALADGLETDYAIKSGLTQDVLAVEMLILRQIRA